ncbi:MAG TPA: tetratricopeptide repeat protein [Anaeromyxobacter sp.]|nr:tetratricopeptide repeat protein [Anaeromyxobacter sp.]
MRLFSKHPKTRSEILADADRARSRGNARKAAAAYQAALKSDPTDPSVNVKLGPLLAKLGDPEGGARCFRVAAKRHLDAGFVDRAAGVTLTATGVFPLDPSFRLELARLNVLRGRKQDAVATLLDGGRAQAKAKRPDLAASLLGKALEIEPWHLEACLALVPVLARNGHPESAGEFLAGLEKRYHGPSRRRVRWVAFRLAPGPRTFWRWIRA